MKHKYVYHTTYSCMSGDVVLSELELRIVYTLSYATRDYYDKGAGQWLPGDPAELGIVEIYEEVPHWETHKMQWVPVRGKFPDGTVRYDFFCEWAETELEDQLIENAADTDDDERAQMRDPSV